MAGRVTTTAFALLGAAIAVIGITIGVLMSRHGAMKVGGAVDLRGHVDRQLRVRRRRLRVGRCVRARLPRRRPARAGGLALRVAGSGDAARLWLFPQGGRQGALTIDKPSCSQWDVQVDWAHQTVNRVNTVSGHVRVRCTAGGGKVTADVRFERCAQ